MHLPILNPGYGPEHIQYVQMQKNHQHADDDWATNEERSRTHNFSGVHHLLLSLLQKPPLPCAVYN